MNQRYKSLQVKRRKRITSIILSLSILIAYIVLQVSWGVNLYKANKREEIKILENALSRSLSCYAYDEVIQNANDPDRPGVVLEPITDANQPEDDKIVGSYEVHSKEELSNLIEDVLVMEGIILDSLILDKISNCLESDTTINMIVSYQLTLSSGDSLLLAKQIDRGVHSLLKYKQAAEKMYESSDNKYILRLEAKSRLPHSLILVLIFFIIGVVILIVYIFLVTKLYRDLKKEQLEASMQYRYFYGLVHDLKLPLSATYALLDGVQAKMISESISDELVDKMAVANEQILRLTDQVQSLLILRADRDNHGQSNQQLKYFFLNEMIEDIATELKSYYAERHIRIEGDFADDFTLNLPEEQMRVILRALLDNAVKYNGEEPLITISATKEKGELKIVIQDNGKGINGFSNNRAKKITLKNISEISSNSSSGIGLLTVWTQINKLGGKLLYQLAYPNGSIFTIIIPEHKGDEKKSNAH